MPGGNYWQASKHNDKNQSAQSGVVAHTFNPSTQEAEAGG
jgi:hypothetical protein